MNLKEQVYKLLSTIPDPEIPVINIIELGIVRDVKTNGNATEVYITPTYSGCPAMKQIENDIIRELNNHKIPNPVVKLIYSPAWTTDWISDEAKEKLRKYGIAPPEHTSVDKRVLMGLQQRVVCCPQCNSKNTHMISLFGSTACKALYQCSDCQEPFDYFKCL